MKILAIRHTENEIYIQIERAKNFIILLNKLTNLLNLDPGFHFEEAFMPITDSEFYSSVSNKKNEMQVVVSKIRVHIIIKANLQMRRKIAKMIGEE